MALSGLYSSYYSDEDTGKPRDYTAAYGGIPNLPKYTTDTTRVLGPDVKAQLIANLPGYQNMLNQDVANIQSYQRGQVPADVLSLLQQQAAERGVGTGIPGSQNVDAAYLRALGLTSLQLQQMGHSMLGEQIAWTPIQQSQLTTQTRDLGAERAVYAAAPNPYAAALQAMRDAMAGISAGKGGNAPVRIKTGHSLLPGGIGNMYAWD